MCYKPETHPKACSFAVTDLLTTLEASIPVISSTNKASAGFIEFPLLS
jgi:hypothetical protein